MKKIFTLILIGILISSCSNNDDDDTNGLFNAVVIGKGLDCGDSFLIKFNENTYYEINLPNEFKVAGKEIKIAFRDPKENEYLICTTLGPGYKLIYILSAESR